MFLVTPLLYPGRKIALRRSSADFN